MSQHKASILAQKQGKLEVGVRSTSVPQGNQALVKVTAAAINPVDWKIQDYGWEFVEKYPAVLGTDGAGVIEAVGPAVTDFKPGDKIFFQGFYGRIDETAFQEKSIVETDIISKVPDNITEDEASTIPVAALAALVGLFQGTGIDVPANGPTAQGRGVLILGGSSSVGQFGIQLARIAGFSPIVTTASAQHVDLLKSLGATHVFDRNVDAKTIQSAFPAPVSLVLDSISAASTQSLAFDVLTTPSLVPGAHLAVGLPIADYIKEKNKGFEHPILEKRWTMDQGWQVCAKPGSSREGWIGCFARGLGSFAADELNYQFLLGVVSVGLFNWCQVARVFHARRKSCQDTTYFGAV